MGKLVTATNASEQKASRGSLWPAIIWHTTWNIVWIYGQELISLWHDRQIPLGDDWAKDIDVHLERASLILLLISANFLASDYCYSVEMKRAMERHEAGSVHVIPILLDHCDWSYAPFSKLQVLILGESGSGKSTQLYILAQHLIDQANQDQACPLPIIFPLSSWAVNRLSLQHWMGEQLARLYDVPGHLAQQWIQEGQILPLLDGLDEMDEAARPDCIRAINMYYRACFRPLVVCSRSVEYEVASKRERLALQNAVIVQPLSTEQIEAVLAQGGESLVALRTAYRENPMLRELATTPLMLNLLILTYERAPVKRPFRNEASPRRPLRRPFRNEAFS